MASKLGFRQHIMLLLFLDIFALLFMLGVGTKSSFLVDFILNPALNPGSGIFFTILGLFVGISAIGVTSGNNYAGITGVISSFLGIGVKIAGKVVSSGTLVIVIADYLMIYNFLIAGQEFGMLNIVGLILFIPLIVDAIFASIDWARGANT